MDRASSGPIELMETVLVLTRGTFTVKPQPRKLIPKQSTRANVIGPLAHVNFTDVWNIRQMEKKTMFGPDNLPLPGGQCPTGHQKEKRTKPTELVPAFYHEGPPSLAMELGHAACCTGKSST